MAHIGQERRFEHVGLFGLLAGDHQLSLALFERALEAPRAQEKRRDEDQQQHQQYDTRHEQLDVMGIFREFGRYGILDHTPLGKGVFGNLQLFELARIEEVLAVRKMEMRPVYPARCVVLLDLRSDDRGCILVFGDIATHGHVADADLGYREDRDARIELHQVVERTLHEVLPVAAHTPGTEYRRGTVRQRRIGIMHRLVPFAAVHQHKVHVGIVLHLLAHECLERNTPVGVIRDEGDVLGLGEKRTDQLDIAADVVLVEHTAHIVQAVRHVHVIDRRGQPHAETVLRRREHDAIGADIAAEAHHILGDMPQRDERRPSLLPQQDDGAKPLVLIPGNHVLGLRHPDRCVVDALAFERFDIDITRYARGQDVAFELGDEARHAARIGIIRRNYQDALPLLRLLRPEQCRQQGATEKKHPKFYHGVSGHSFPCLSRKQRRNPRTEFIRPQRFGKTFVEAGLEHALAVGLERIGRKCDDGDIGRNLPHAPKRLIAVHDGHVDVHQHQVGAAVGKQGDGLFSVPCV